MKREIKFRVRNLKEGCVDHVWGNPEKIFINASDGKAYYFDGFANTFLEYDDPENISIEQYTGLKDISGKSVYEGDIVNIINDGREYNGLTVVYSDEICGFMAVSDKWDLFLYRVEYIEIIGNIHDKEANQ